MIPYKNKYAQIKLKEGGLKKDRLFLVKDDPPPPTIKRGVKNYFIRQLLIP